MTRKSLRILTTVWGEKHLSWLEKYCVRSLSWNKNAEAIHDATWTFMTKAEDKEKIEFIVTKSGIKVKLDFLIFGPEFDKNPHSAGTFINQGLLMEMSRCITYGAQMFLAPPDTVFGGGCVPHMLEIADQRDVVVFAVHARVHPEISLHENMSNAQLVSSAWKVLHKTWSEAEFGLEKINTYIGGVLWRYLSENIYSVQHLLPTPYVFNWTPEDLVFFKNQIHWGVVDHAWPSACLIDTERQRVVGSSDGAFMVEITEAENNIPPTAAYHREEPDLFWKKLPHNKHNRMFNVILRGE